MRLARVGIVTPIRDGMNLVAKEYIAAQDPADPGRSGAVALRRRGGALDSALLVNPHDAEGMAELIVAALDMPLAERRMRWQAAWAAIAGTSRRVGARISCAPWHRRRWTGCRWRDRLRSASRDGLIRPAASG